MIKNRVWIVLVVVTGGCGPDPASEESAQGVVELEERVLAFEVPGRVERVQVDDGDTFEAGSPLAELDLSLETIGRDARAAELAAARARLALLREGARPEELRTASAEVRAARSGEALLERNVARQRALLAQGASTQLAVDDLEGRLDQARAHRQALEQQSRLLRDGARNQEIEAAEAAVAAAEAGVRLADARLARHTLESEEDGVVLAVHVEPGEVVAPGTPVVTVADPARPYVDVFVPQGAVDGIDVGTEAEVTTDATPGPFAGRVEHVSRRTEFTPRFLFSERERPNLVLRVRVRIEDPDHQLHAGLPAFAKWVR
jgi:HlyD family secretion protein